MAKPDLSGLDRVDPDVVARLGPWWQRVYRALKTLRDGVDRKGGERED